MNEKRALVITTLMASTLTVMAGSIIGPIVNAIKVNLGLSSFQAGLIITTHGLFIAIFSPLAGIIIDKFGSRYPFSLGLIFYGLSGGMGVFLNSFIFLVISRVFMGIATAFVFTSITVIILENFNGNEKDKVMGYRGSANSLSAVIWPLIGGILGTFSWHFTFAVYYVGIFIGVISFFILSEENRKQDSSQARIKFRSLLKNVDLEIFFIYLLMFANNVFLYGIVVFLPQKLGVFGIHIPYVVSFFLAAQGLSGGIFAALYSKIRSHLNYKSIAILSLVSWSIGYLTIFLLKSPWLFLLSVFFTGIGQGTMIPTVMLWLDKKVKPEYRGRFTSILGTTGFLGQFMSPIIFGLIADKWNINNLFFTGSILSLLLLTILFFTGKKTGEAT
ncbi:MAG: MFS transporter [Kosmotoga sp.]|nr:MAG: MFS transporter [Kosmotoga sp.]